VPSTTTARGEVGVCAMQIAAVQTASGNISHIWLILNKLE